MKILNTSTTSPFQTHVMLKILILHSNDVIISLLDRYGRNMLDFHLYVIKLLEIGYELI
jgi:hypothetical protein